MRLPFILSLLLAARAGVHDVPPEARRAPRGRAHGRGVGVGIAAWHRSRAEQRLARLEIAQEARAAIAGERQFGDELVIWRHVRNAAKRRRRAIRAQGGQA